MLSLHIIDIIDNSTYTGTNAKSITIVEDTVKNTLFPEIINYGTGDSEDVIKKVTGSFLTAKMGHHVGLSIP